MINTNNKLEKRDMKRIELTPRQYDKIVDRYEKTKEAKDLSILQNCIILMKGKKWHSKEKYI